MATHKSLEHEAQLYLGDPAGNSNTQAITKSNKGGISIHHPVFIQEQLTGNASIRNTSDLKCH